MSTFAKEYPLTITVKGRDTGKKSRLFARIWKHIKADGDGVAWSATKPYTLHVLPKKDRP